MDTATKIYTMTAIMTITPGNTSVYVNLIIMFDMSRLESVPVAGFTDGFSNWLREHYPDSSEQIIALSRTSGFGGRFFPEQTLSKTPVIFVHGQSGSDSENRGFF